jgi:hypothetical protein
MKLLPLLGVGLVLYVVACADSEGDPAPTDPNASGAAVPTAPGAPLGATQPAGNANDPASSDAPTGTQPAPAPGASNDGVFAGAPPYQAILGPSTIDKTGKGNGHLSFDKDGNPAGKPCLDCHDGTGKGGAPAFVFAGTVYADAAGTKPAPRVEVRVLGADGKASSAYTDLNGNFFFRAGSGVTVVPATAGARTASASRTMGNKINDANCNQCHGTTARVTL